MSMSMGIGVRVGAVPTSSGSSNAASRRRHSSGTDGDGTYGNCGADGDSDFEGDGKSSTTGTAHHDLQEKWLHGSGKSNSSRSISTTTSNFMQIPVKNAELKDKLRSMGGSNGGVAVGSGSTTRASFVLPSQRHKQEQRDKRRSSVLLSLAMLDVPGDDEEDHLDSFHDNGGNSIESAIPAAEANEKAHAGAPLHSTEPKGRYLRRGSVTKHQLVANVDAMQPSVHTQRAAAPYLPDSSHATHPPSHSDLPARADYQQDETDYNATGYASDSYGYTSDASVSNSHAATSQRRRQSSAAALGNATAPPLTSQNGQSRYLRRGNVTHHKLNPPIGTIQPTHHRSLDRNESHDHDKDDSSVVSMPPLSSSASFSSQPTDALPPRQKYHRRGSVTKFSLDSYLQNPTHTKGLQGEGKNSSSSNVDYGYNNDDNDNGSVVSMPPLSSSASYSQSKDALPPRQKYNRRGSVTKFSLDSFLQNPTHTKGLQGEGKNSSSSNNVDYGYNTDDNDNGSVVSMPPLSYSQSTDALPPRSKYHRRGSVTKFSLDSYLQNPTHTKGLQGEGKNASSNNTNVDYGYNDDNDNASVVSMPALSSAASYSKSTDALPPRPKYHRRGSVTKFSLDASQLNPNHAAALQPSGEKETNQVASSLPAPLTAKSNHNDSDIDSDSDSEDDKRPKPKPGDDDYSENLENSGRFARRSISVSMDADDIKPNVFTDSKRPPLPRAHSASSALPSMKPKKKLLAPQGRTSNASGVDTNHIQIRMTNDTSTQSPPKNNLKSALEDDSGHVKKTWYSPTPPSVTRRDSMSSLDSENSDAEFGSEIVDSQPKQRSPPRLPPHNKARVVEASKPNDSTSKEPTNEKTTIDGKFLNLASSSFDDIASNSGHSDDDDDAAETQPSRKKPLRGRRSSIVGIPSSNDAGYTSLDDTSSHVDRDEGMPTPKPTKMRARRTSIVGIPTIDPASPPSNSPSKDEAKEKISKTKSTSSASQETSKPKKKATSKSKLSSTKVKKSGQGTDSSPSIGAVPTISERRGCLKLEDATGLPKKVRFGHLVITEFPIILGDNPAVTSGAPVTIDWTPQKETRLSINAYEQCKPRRRRRRKLLISVSNRAILLLAAGYSIDEIADASIDAQQIKQGRQQTLDNQSWDRINHMLETTGDAIGGILLQPLQMTGKKLKSLVVKPQQQTTSARMA